MTLKFLLTCLLIGISAASGVGPIFLLTLNRSALFGFWKGFAIAVGSALADSLYFALSLFGILSFLESFQQAFIITKGLGGIALIMWGIHMLKASYKNNPDLLYLNENFFVTCVKAFFLTLLNPLALIFFTFTSIQALSPSLLTPSIKNICWGSVMVGLGSLLTLTTVATGGKLLGNKITRKKIMRLSSFMGFLLVCFGLYLILDIVFGPIFH